MKKSLVAVMLGLMMTVSLVGCGGCGTEVAEEVATEVVEEPTEVVEEVESTEVVEEVAEEEPTEVAEEVVEEPATEEVVEETPAVEEVSPYSYTELNQVMYAQSTVNVRDLPEQTGGKVGSLSTNQEVTVTGQCNETGWYRISYNGGEGFVSNSYLGTEKVAVKSSSSSTASQSSQSASQSSQAPAESTASVPEAPAEAPAPSAPEAPAEESSSTDSGQVKDDNYYYEQATTASDIMPEHWYCGWCNDGVDYGSAEAFDAHALDVHGVY